MNALVAPPLGLEEHGELEEHGGLEERGRLAEQWVTTTRQAR